MRCEYAHDDGAYVLGALSPAERSAYERHLSSCPACREAVAEIAVLPGLLGRLDSTMAVQLLGRDDAVDDADGGQPWPMMNRADAGEARVTSLVAAAAQRRRRERRARRMRYAATVLMAACLAVVAGLGVGFLREDADPNDGVPAPGDTPGVQMVAMSEVTGTVPVTAQVGLERRSWGTEVTMECQYSGRKAWTYRLIAYGPDDEREQIGSWVAAPGRPVSFRAATRFGMDQLVRLELTRADGGALLAYDLP
jgi:hypothetical protein